MEFAPTEIDMYANITKMKKACSEFTKLFIESKAVFVNY